MLDKNGEIEIQMEFGCTVFFLFPDVECLTTFFAYSPHASRNRGGSQYIRSIYGACKRTTTKNNIKFRFEHGGDGIGINWFILSAQTGRRWPAANNNNGDDDTDDDDGAADDDDDDGDEDGERRPTHFKFTLLWTESSDGNFSFDF